MEGSLRVPFIIRWPGKVPAGVTSNEMVHATDIFTSILEIASAEVPSDRPIDGISQVAFFKDPTAVKSQREGFLFYIKDELRAVKWKDWKLHLV
ncbi:arylsulfatase A [Fusarium mexicanum]|uniref:Arylsulfatase A n=1 Tax=Fusarium mexicanum TaxID=751941 RepID=A0A8H5IYR5_9HYPO|nr:arylsulfatase A [Fusarium mexicanum]